MRRAGLAGERAVCGAACDDGALEHSPFSPYTQPQGRWLVTVHAYLACVVAGLDEH